jgi:hypothetical protein
MHMPNLHFAHSHVHAQTHHMHDMGMRAYRVTHDERFWVVVAIAILATLIALAAWVGFNAGPGVEAPKMRPYFPYF